MSDKESGTPRTKWSRSQRFRLTPAGREAGRAYRQDIVASRVEAGRKSFDAARAEWAANRVNKTKADAQAIFICCFFLIVTVLRGTEFLLRAI